MFMLKYRERAVEFKYCFPSNLTSMLLYHLPSSVIHFGKSKIKLHFFVKSRKRVIIQKLKTQEVFEE